MKEKKIVFIGGDSRQLAAAQRVSELGCSVHAWGIPGEMPENVVRIDDISAAYDADILVLPLPMSGDGITVNCTGIFSDFSPKISDIFENAKNIPICAGRIAPKIKNDANRLGIRIFDYFESEELKIKNAYLTAEGAVSLAMNELSFSLAGTKTAVIGYGRIGKFLARMLHSLESSVTVAARKGTDLAYVCGFGYNALKIEVNDGESSLSQLSEFDIVFNTAPYWVLDEAVLKNFTPKTLVIDLASAPGGVDPEAAKKYGIKVISAQGLPGKYAPLTAGRFVGDAIGELIPKIK